MNEEKITMEPDERVLLIVELVDGKNLRIRIHEKEALVWMNSYTAENPANILFVSHKEKPVIAVQSKYIIAAIIRDKRSARKIAREYGMYYGTIYKIKQRIAWKHVI